MATVWQEILAGSNSEKLITSKKNQSVVIEKKLFPQNTTNILVVQKERPGETGD